MPNELFDTKRLSDQQMVDLLGLGLEPSDRPEFLSDEFRRLNGLSAGELLQAVRDRLHAHGLDVSDAARLLGVNELTARRWFESSTALAENARNKLAGLCLLLSLVADEARDSEAAGMVRAALAGLRKGTRPDAAAESEPAATLVSVFGVAGLMAAAFHVALTPERSDLAVEEEED